VVVFGSVSSDCSLLGLYVPYALLYLLFASMVHTQRYFDMLRCAALLPPLRPPSATLQILPCSSKKLYITFVLCHYLRSLSLPSSHLDSLRVLYCYC
jgi:hypothetical protein